MTHALEAFARGVDEPAIQHLAPEAVLVEGVAQDRLVDEAQVPQRERLRQQLEPDRRVVQLAADPLDRGGEDPVVVEGEGEDGAARVADLDAAPSSPSGGQTRSASASPVSPREPTAASSRSASTSA